MPTIERNRVNRWRRSGELHLRRMELAPPEATNPGRSFRQLRALQQAYQRLANLPGQLHRGRVFEDVSDSLDREVITDVLQRIVLTESPEGTRLFLWFHIRKAGKKSLITVRHGCATLEIRRG